MKRRLLLIVMPLLALLLTSLPADAAPDRGTFHDEDAGVLDCSESWDSVTTVTDPDTGLSLTTRNWGLVGKDQTITDNGDGTLTIRVLSPAPVAIYAPDGHMLSHFTGSITYVLLIDDGGTPGTPATTSSSAPRTRTATSGTRASATSRPSTSSDVLQGAQDRPSRLRCVGLSPCPRCSPRASGPCTSSRCCAPARPAGSGSGSTTRGRRGAPTRQRT